MTTDKIVVRGQLRTKVYKHGKLILDDTSDNMVVGGGLNALMKLLAGDTPAVGKPITKGAVGTSGTAPAFGDTVITAAFFKAISLVTYATPQSVRFDYAIETSEDNGANIVEYGLLNADNVLYARITKPVIVKDNTIRIECQWTITASAI